MKFTESINRAGRKEILFQDEYGLSCVIRESSSVDPHIWLGVPKPKVSIMYKDAQANGLDLQKDNPETNSYGFCTIPIPKEALIESEMHLSREDAKTLGKKLIEFSKRGKI